MTLKRKLMNQRDLAEINWDGAKKNYDRYGLWNIGYNGHSKISPRERMEWDEYKRSLA